LFLPSRTSGRRNEAAPQPSADRRIGGVPAWALALGAITALGLALRLWGIKYGLPFAYQTDEERLYVRMATYMLGHSTLDPHYFMNPPAFTYLLMALFKIGFGDGASHLYVAMPDRGDLFLTARSAVAVIGTAAIPLVFLAARRLFDDLRVALIAALLIAVAFLPVFYSHVALDNVPAMAAATLSLVGSAAILHRGERGDFLLAGAGLGIAAATKYIDGIVVVPLLVAALLSPLDARAKLRGAGVALGVAALAFLVLNPYSVLDFEKFRHDLDVQSETAGMEKIGQDAGGGIPHYLHTFGWGLGYLPAAFAVLGAGFLWRRERRLFWVLVPVLALFILYMGLKTRYFGRWMLPVFPIACMLAAYGAVRLVELATARRAALRPALLGVAAAALAAQSIVYVIHNDRVLSRPHTLNLARNWLWGNVDESAKLIIEPQRSNVWRRPWPNSQYRLSGGGEEDPIEYSEYLNPGLVAEYQRLGYCLVMASSDYWGPAFADSDEAPGAPAYYRALERQGTVVYSASPWGDLDSPVGPGRDRVGFGFDWSFDFYPMAYTHPGPAVVIYRLRGGRCSPAAERGGSGARRARSYPGTASPNAPSPHSRSPQLRPRRADSRAVSVSAGARPGAGRPDPG
jgi:4-amino-4-deoxy-L-arabinose transferase-like glycosyltransferase